MGELLGKIQPIDYGKIAAGQSVVLLGVGEIFRNTVLADHLVSQAPTFRELGFSHFVTALTRLTDVANGIPYAMAKQGINTSGYPYEIRGFLKPGSKVAVLLDAYSILKPVVDEAVTLSEPFRASLDRGGIPTASVFFTGSSKVVPQEVAQALENSEWNNRDCMIDLTEVKTGQGKSTKAGINYVKALDYIVHLKGLNTDVG